MDEDQDFKNFMAKYESQDDDINDIMKAADSLLGQTLTGLTFNQNTVDDNPYKRSKKTEPVKVYNKPDPNFNFILNMGTGQATGGAIGSPSNPRRSNQAKIVSGKSVTGSVNTEVNKIQAKTTKIGSQQSKRTIGSPSTNERNLFQKMASPKSKLTGKNIGFNNSELVPSKISNISQNLNISRIKDTAVSSNNVEMKPAQKTDFQLQEKQPEIIPSKALNNKMDQNQRQTNAEKIDQLLSETTTKPSYKNRALSSAQTYDKPNKVKVINSPAKKFCSSNYGLDKAFGLKTTTVTGRSPQRSSQQFNEKAQNATISVNPVTNNYRSSSLTQSKLKTDYLKFNQKRKNPVEVSTNINTKKDTSEYDFTKKLDSKAADRANSSVRDHRKSETNNSNSNKNMKDMRLPSYMGKRTRGYIGQKTFLGRMEILEQDIPEEDPRHPNYQFKSLTNLKNLDDSSDLIYKPQNHTQAKGSPLNNFQIGGKKSSYRELNDNFSSSQNQSHSQLYDSFNDFDFKQHKDIYLNKTDFQQNQAPQNNFSHTYYNNYELSSSEQRLFNTHMSYAKAVNKKYGNKAKLYSMNEQVDVSKKQNGTVVIKPQFFSNFQIVNIDNMIPVMGSNNTNLTVNRDTTTVNNNNTVTKASGNQSKVKKGNKSKMGGLSSNLGFKSAKKPKKSEKTSRFNTTDLLTSKKMLSSKNLNKTNLGKQLRTQLEGRKSLNFDLDFKEEEVLANNDSKSDDSMILGSKRSPSNKKNNSSNPRGWGSANKSISMINQADLGTCNKDQSFNDTVFNQKKSQKNITEFELKNVEFETSYDFTKDIGDKNKKSDNQNTSYVNRNTLMPSEDPKTSSNF